MAEFTSALAAGPRLDLWGQHPLGQKTERERERDPEELPPWAPLGIPPGEGHGSHSRALGQLKPHSKGSEVTVIHGGTV